MKYITCYFIDQYFRQLYKFFEQYKIWITIDESLHSSYIQATRNFILLIYRNHRLSIDYPHLKYFIIDRLWKVWMDVNTRRIRFISALRFPLCSYNTPIIALQWKCLWLINIFFHIIDIRVWIKIYTPTFVDSSVMLTRKPNLNVISLISNWLCGC